MFFNRRKPKDIDIEGVKFTIKPFDCYQQIEFGELVDEMLKDTKALPKAVRFIFENLVQDVQGLTDEDGEAVAWDSMDMDEKVKGFSTGYLNLIVSKTLDLIRLSSDKKKE